uniref:TSC22 domain family, member 1 n=1 Tax=Fundulus heteroclitus TaxID=8078 RepID=A0A3Q2T3U2_FUNHE
MHHPDPAGDSGSVRKMQHQAVFHRRGSGGGGSTLPAAANPAVANNSSHVAADDYQPPASTASSTSSSSSSGPHHPPPPPHSLNLQPAQPTGAKKKSGFQITSVTLATVTVSTNNSIAEDTESYMESDMDESHTEDLSSSEILDVSLSRANDAVGAERSSSEETLNNFHEAETPGAVSPNQPSHPHALAQAQQRGGGGGAMVNGTMHHQHPNHAQSYPLTGALAQKMPSNVGGPQENVSHAAPPSVVPQPAGVVTPGSLPGMHSSAAGSTVSVANPQTSSVSNVNMLSSANVPVRGGVSTGASGGGGAGGVAAPTGGSHMSAANVNMIQQQQQNINSVATAAAVSASGGAGVPSGTQGRVGSAASAPAAAAGQMPAAAPAPAPAVTATTSRFRVVKLDSSSEPFKKGRWMCTEFYDKDAPSAPAASEAAASLSSRQFVTESFAAATAGASERERESTSGSSVSSTVSTLSHYVENVGSGEAGGSPVPQHAQDYASPPQGYQGIIPSGLSMGVPHSQAHMHTQDLNHSHLKTTAAPSAPASVHQPAAMPGQQTVPPQQLTYAQAVIANQTPGSSQGLQQQKMGYAPLPQQSAASQPAAPGSVRAPEYNPAQQGAPQAAAAASQPLSSQAGSVPAGPANGATQMMGGPQQPQGLLHTPAPASSVPLGQPPQGHVDVQQKPQSLATPVQNAGPNAQLPEHQAHGAANVGRMAPQPSSMGLMQDHSSVQALVHAAQASALYASLPSFTTTQLQDAQRLLLQHQSLLKLSGSNAGLGQETEGNSNAASALTAPAGLKTVDGEDDGSSGASVVAIDNKIEQAMVSFPPPLSRLDENI